MHAIAYHFFNYMPNLPKSDILTYSWPRPFCPPLKYEKADIAQLWGRHSFRSFPPVSYVFLNKNLLREHGLNKHGGPWAKRKKNISLTYCFIALILESMASCFPLMSCTSLSSLETPSWPSLRSSCLIFETWGRMQWNFRNRGLKPPKRSLNLMEIMHLVFCCSLNWSVGHMRKT